MGAEGLLVVVKDGGAGGLIQRGTRKTTGHTVPLQVANYNFRRRLGMSNWKPKQRARNFVWGAICL